MTISDKELLGRLVAFDSTSRNSNLPIADFVCEYLDRPGVSVRRNPSPDGTKVNVVAVAGPEPAGDGAGLILSGHLDTVPADEEGWESDPFRLTEAGETWVARGACDMKASIALAMNIVAGIDTKRLTSPLAALFTYDEELGTLGAKRFVETWPPGQPLPRNVLVGEPTSLRAVRMHKAHLTMRITARGRSAHTGSPHLGINAIESAGRTIQALTRLAGVIKQRHCDTSRFFSTVPYPVLTIARISGGDAVNVIPDRCVMDIGIRLLPGMNVRDSIELVRDTVTKSDPHGSLEVEVVNNSPPMLCDDHAEVHTALCELLGQRQSYGVSFASDAGPLQELGCESVLFGPGSIDVAHKPNEHVPIDEFTRARPVLERLVEHFCL